MVDMGRKPERPEGADRARIIWTVVVGLLALAWLALVATLLTGRVQPPFPPPKAPQALSAAPLPEPAPPPVPAPSEPRLDRNGVAVQSPRWVRRPQPIYPSQALRQGIEEGAVSLRCEGMAEGVLGACEVLSESPEGAGFAEAALAGTRHARLAPQQLDGTSVDSTVVFTVRFRMED